MPSGRSDLIDVDVDLIHETDRAWLFSTDGENRIWVPKTLGEYDEDGKQVALPRRIAEEKGLV